MSLPRTRLASWWAGVGRHQRLQGAVLSAFAVVLLMAISLVASVAGLVSESKSDLGLSQELLALQDDILRVNSVLDGYDGSSGAKEELAREVSDLSIAVGAIGSSLDSGWMEELRTTMPSVIALSDSSLDGMAAAAKGTELAEDLEPAAVQITKDSQDLASRSHARLVIWFKWVLVVTVAAISFLALSVWKAILPLNSSIRRSLAKLESWTEAAARRSRRRELAAQLTDGLDAATSEAQAYTVIERSLREITADHKVEVILADSSNAHMRTAVTHPDTGRPGCDVVSPWSCPAVRRGSTLTFTDSTSIRACPHLAQRGTPCSAICAPLVFMGQPIGVVHAAGPAGMKPPPELVDDLGALASEGSTRLGTIRAFARAELQASTDVLTGLANRRATEDRVARLVAASTVGALALVEIGGLVELNARLGKEGGDHALRLFADTVRESIRSGDWCGRWAGAQFVMVLDAMSALEAQRRLVAVRKRVLAAFETAEMGELVMRVGVADSAGVVDARSIISAAQANLEVVRDEGGPDVGNESLEAAPDQVPTREPAEA